MSFLTNIPPNEVIINNRKFSINSDFRVILYADEILHNQEIEEDKRAAMALSLFYGDVIPDDTGEAVKEFISFLRRGKTPLTTGQTDTEDKEKTGAPRADFSFKYDGELIYAAFLTQYRIDLQSIEYLHWWNFMALMEGLNSEHKFMEIRRCRSVNITADMSNSQKAYYRAMKKAYALPLPENQQKELNRITDALMHGGDVSAILSGGEENSY